MQPDNKLCSIVVKDGTNQSHNISEIYNIHPRQSTNFMNTPHIVQVFHAADSLSRVNQ